MAVPEPEDEPPKGYAIGHLTEDVRLAMAWNGGVSLAIWMGGVAVELDAARRGVPAAGQSPAGPARLDRSPSRCQQLYTAIRSAFGRTLTIDILCGASAGGINGALLAGAIQKTDGALEPEFVRTRWLEIGDFDSLLQPIDNNQPVALMQGQLFHDKLQEVFSDLLNDYEADSAESAAEVLLDVQVTDVEGKEHSFVDDWNELLYAREYRAPVRFRKAGDYTAGTLAAAARASASFPGAFEAQKLNGVAAHLAGFPDQERWAIDGGVLENAPIRQAIELIPLRRASGPVKRFVCYVDADPQTHLEPAENPAEPQLAKVLSYTMGLPRKARMIDQLRALEDAKRRGGLGAAGVELLGAEPSCLIAVANVLLPTYRERRALLSLAELLDSPGVSGGPGIAHEILSKLGSPEELPWIPLDLQAPSSPEDWSWGVRPAQRILQLQLELLATALSETSEPPDADTIFTAREQIDIHVARFDALQRDFTDGRNAIAIEAQKLRAEETRASALAALRELTAGTDVVISESLRASAGAFMEAVDALLSPPALASIPSREQLFGDRPGREYEHFLELALAVEVIRRSFSDDIDIEPAQKLHVAQLTPGASTLLFTAKPLSSLEQDQGPSGAEEKLTGIRLGHFAAFYRSSWRANDFMWGRLDGASHTVRLLVDADRACALQAHGRTPWSTLANELVPLSTEPGDADRRQLLREALLPVERVYKDDELPPDDPEKAQALLLSVEDRIKEDLTTGDGELTRALCTRALQYEVFREEAQYVSRQAHADQAAGAYVASLGWDTNDPLLPLIKELRNWRGKSSLPRKLGRDSSEEMASTLAARTVSHAALVALTALTGVVPLARFFQPARVPLLAVQGMSTQRLLDRIAAAIGFTGAAWYLAARYLTLPEPSQAHPVPIGALWSAATLALCVSLLAVVGMTVMPAIRAIRAEHPRRRLIQGAWAAGLVAAGGGVALGWQWSLNGTAVALTTSGAKYTPPQWLLLLVVAAGGFQVASQIESLSGVLALLRRPIRDKISTTGLLITILGATMAALTMWNAIWPAGDHWGWKTTTFALALVAPVLIAFYLRVLAKAPE